MIAIPSQEVSLSRKFLAEQADASLALSAPNGPDLASLLLNTGGPIPPGDFVLGSLQAKVKGATPLQFDGGAGKVTFSGGAAAAFSLGVYTDSAKAIQAAAPAPELASTLSIAPLPSTRFLVLSSSYDLTASAKGSVALGAGAAVTFGATGSNNGAFALLHRFSDTDPASQVFEDLFTSWALPRQITDALDLVPGTWLIAEVDGSVALQLGIQAGYDFTWVREIPGGKLQGDIGLRIQLGASAAFGFEVEGKYAVVLARESADQTLRLRLFKMARKGWNFAFDARTGINAELPAFVNQARKPEDLVAAVFGLNANQVIEVLRETRAFVDSQTALLDKLAGVVFELGGTALENTSGLAEAQLLQIHAAGRANLTDFITKFDQLASSAGHDVTSLLVSLPRAEHEALTTTLRTIAGASEESQVQQIVSGLVSKAGFERTIFGRLSEAAVGPALGALNDTSVARKLQGVARDTLAVLDQGCLQKLLDFLRRKVAVDQVLAGEDASAFARLDNLLKARLAAFLGKEQLVLDDLNQIQTAIRALLTRVDQFFTASLAAAKRKQEVAWNARYARSETGTALIDLSFDTRDPVARDFLRKAIAGDFNEVLLAEQPGVTLHAAALTHDVTRNVSTQLTFPFGAMSDSSALLSAAKLTVTEDNGRVLVYTLNASDTESEHACFFSAQSARDSTLTVTATLPLAVGQTWKEDTAGYAYRMQRAALKLRADRLEEELGPMAAQYLPAAFTAPGKRFPDWVADLDRALDGKDGHAGSHFIGDTLVTLDLIAPPACLRAWRRAPKDRSDPAYMTLSRALQAKLKELVTFYWFSDPARYKDLAAAAAPIVYSSIPPCTSIRFDDAGALVEIDTGVNVYWDQADQNKVKAMAWSAQTRSALAARLAAISKVLQSIPELSACAPFYAPTEAPQLIKASLQNNLLASLLFLEARLVDSAVSAGTQMAQFLDAAGQNPAEALKHLAAFGERLVETFNERFGKNPFLSGAARPLATLLYVEAASAFDPDVARAVTARLNITVIRSGKLTAEEMLAGKIAGLPKEDILYEQPFVQA